LTFPTASTYSQRVGLAGEDHQVYRRSIVAQIRPFAGVHYANLHGGDVSPVIAPPYDVLDVVGRAALQAKHPQNVVNIDLPHLPAKTAGPDEVYATANVTLNAWLRSGTLKKDVRPALYPYSQSYEHAGRMFHRKGFIALVRLSPFGAGDVIPHEKTYKGPIEDRLKLMRATGMQLSPIFGLFSDPRNEITNLLFHQLGRPELSGTMDSVKNDLWSVTDGQVENDVIDRMATRPVYIADGHHRYTTALQFQEEARIAAGGKLPPTHPANFCMFVLVGMQDDGLLILPTHRLIGGLDQFSIEAFRAAVASHFDVIENPVTPEQVPFVIEKMTSEPAHTFSLFDGASRKLYTLKLKSTDPLHTLEPGQSPAWRSLDVAILQRYLLDDVLQPNFAGGKELTKGYTADPKAVVPMTDGKQHQIALILKPTPLHALEELGKHGEVMPQKSTYFFPKLATGMMMYPLK
jgi:uncharacterized protein (DUF1015 family)